LAFQNQRDASCTCLLLFSWFVIFLRKQCHCFSTYQLELSLSLSLSLSASISSQSITVMMLSGQLRRQLKTFLFRQTNGPRAIVIA